MMRQKKRRARWLVVLGAAAALSGCSVGPYYGAVQFTSRPAGAEVMNLKDDASLGMTPVQVTWESEDGAPEYVTVEFIKQGYQREITSFWVNTRHKSREAAAAELQPVTVELKRRQED